MILARALAIIMAAFIGYIIGSRRPSWEEDRESEPVKHGFGSVLDASDATGMFDGCFSCVGWWACMLANFGLLRYLLFVVFVTAVGWMAFIGWPITYIMPERPRTIVGLVFEPALWAILLPMLAETIAGGVIHQRKWFKR